MKYSSFVFCELKIQYMMQQLLPIYLFPERYPTFFIKIPELQYKQQIYNLADLILLMTSAFRIHIVIDKSRNC